jgi:hypothetical protein
MPLRSMTRARAPALIAGLIVLLPLAATAPAAAAAPCTAAAELTADGYPQRALSLLDTAGEGLCPAERAAAATAVARAEALAAVADGTAGAAAAEQALELDRENGRAAEILGDVPRSRLEELQRDVAAFQDRYLAPLAALALPFLAALAAILLGARLLPLAAPGWPALGRGRAAVLATGLTASVAAAVALTLGLSDAAALDGSRWPLLAPALAVLASAAALVVVRHGAPAAAWLRRFARTGVAASALLLLAVLLTAPSWPLPMLGGGALLAATGIGLTGLWLATRLRIVMNVQGTDGKPDPAAAAHMAALLAQLGAEPPRGLEVPVGADATELSDALASFVVGAPWLRTLAGLITALAGSTPWRATVSPAAGGQLAVSVSRNGRSRAAAIIRPSVQLDDSGAQLHDEPGADQGLGDDEPLVLQRLAAAFILTRLSQVHGPFPGLAGATDWRGLGYHYIATTDLRFDLDRAQRQQVLARALDFDPDNRLAQLAFWNAMRRRSSDHAELTAYREWLAGFVADPLQDEVPDLRLRAAYTTAVVATNTCFVPGSTTTDEQAARRAMRVLDGLIEDARHGRGPQPDETLLRSLTEASVGLEHLWSDGRTIRTPATPRGHYNLGCALASKHDLPSRRALRGSAAAAEQALSDRQAAVHLAVAAADPQVRRWLEQDPQLAAFRSRGQYRRSFLPPPRTDFLDLAPLRPFSDALRSSDTPDAATIAAARGSAGLLVPTMPFAPDLRALVVELAACSQSLRAQTGLSGYEIEILEELLERGLLTGSGLARLDTAERREAVRQVCASIRGRCRPLSGGDGPSAAALLAWWSAASAPPTLAG